MMMAKYRMVRVDFWDTPIVEEEMSIEERYFYLYLLTNPKTTQIGIYTITSRQMAFTSGFTIEKIHSLMDRFINLFKLIRYNPETRELAIQNWGKDNLHKGGKPVMDCIYSELKEVQDTTLIQYVSEHILKNDIRSLYNSFCDRGRMDYEQEDNDLDENDTYKETDGEQDDESFTHRYTIRGQKEKEKENEKEKQQQDLYPNVVSNPDYENSLQKNKTDVKEIVEFWDNNGFGFSNMNAKQQLLSWLDDSSFLQPKEIIIKAMNIACANNKRKLNYVVGILKNWEKESLLTVEEIDTLHEKQKTIPIHRQSKRSFPAGRDIPIGFELDITAGEE
ncbi:DnaD domain protein [Neobacillus niacini]|uniref:DnaD domain protein n=1 Tax=Neobacillus niacini TaxID=86668 RepID=UPI00203FBE2E|nr:DnaD domain protein [Neobacillus niacini]MCM3690937.1 DnaD domain protein [Neobacillus niacini]